MPPASLVPPVDGQRDSVVVPTANVHQPSIRAQTAAHDVSIRSSTIAASVRRGGASHSIGRSWKTIDDPENANTGTSALGNCLRWKRWSHGGGHRSIVAGGMAAPAKLRIVDLIAKHDVEAHEELTGEGNFRLGPAAPMQYREVAAAKVVVGTRGQRRCLAQHPAEESVALLGDLAEMLLVGRGVNRRGQADVTYNVLAVRETFDRAEDEDGGQRRQRADPGMR